MRARFFVFAWSAVVTSGLLAFNNCSEVAFSPTPVFLAGQQQDLDATSQVLIENGAEFTNQQKVQLRLTSPRAVEMKISNQADCADGAWEPFSSSKAWDLSGLNRKVNVYAQYKNLIGNISDCSTDDIVHDNVAPQLTFQNANGHITKDAPLSIRFVATDNLSGVAAVTCLDSSNQLVACTNVMNTSAKAEGTNTVNVVVKDKAGNSSQPFSYNWLWDKTPPTVTINKKPAAVTSGVNADFEFTGFDAGSGIKGYECRLENQAFAACTSPKSYPGLSAGPQKFYVVAIDNAGHRSTEAVHSWMIDLTAPVLRFITTPPAYDKNPVGRFTFDGSDEGVPVTRFECRVDAGAYAACNSPYDTPSLADGPHTVEVRGYDNVNNPSEPIKYSWIIDSKNPTLVIDQKPAAFTKSPLVNFTWTAADPGGSGVAKVECRVGSGAFKACGLTGENFPDVAADGPQKMDARATDKAGNVGEASHSWVVDRTPPTITITSGPAPYVNATNATFTFVGTDANGIQGYMCRIDAGAYVGCNSPASITVANGGHTFFVKSVDRAGNESMPASYSWNVDKDPPIIRVISAPTVLKEGDEAKVSFEVTDLASGVDKVFCGLTSNGGSVAACQAVMVANLGKNLAKGTHVYEIQASDKVGNSITEKLTFQITERPIICDPFVVGGDTTCDGGWVGDIFYLNSNHQTAFKVLQNKTVDYYYANGIRVDALLALKQLFVSTRSFTSGFPSTNGQLIKDNAGNNLIEYFAFRLESVLKLDAAADLPGWYQFAALSDDGSILLTKSNGSSVYNSPIVSNDGDHSTKMGCSSQATFIDDTTRLPLMLKYYQGPRTEIAMTLMWRRVPAMNSALDANCGAEGNNLFFGAPPYADMSTNSLFGKLTTNNGWRVIGTKNFIAPPK